jgi:hypothetical protein
MNGAIPIHIETIGLINGCTDILSSGAFYPEQAYNNTYGIQAITEDVYEASKLAYYQEPGGCRSLTETCRALRQCATCERGLYLGGQRMWELCPTPSYRYRGSCIMLSRIFRGPR